MKNVALLLGLMLTITNMTCSTEKNLSNTEHIFGIWTLEVMGNTIINTSNDEYDDPTLEFSREEELVKGFGGCNSFTGSFKIVGNFIKFGSIASSKKACSGPNVETSYLAILSDQKLSYRFSKGKLYLGGGQRELVFRKGV